MNICKNCEYYKARWIGWPKCTHESAVIADLTNGKLDYFSCDNMRTFLGGHYCGEEGRFYEERK